MFYIYANGESIYNPFDDMRPIYSAKVSVELGKAGSFQFAMPSTNMFYDDLAQFDTEIVVTMDDVYEIFRGRILSITRNYSNVKTVYCEGILAYLVDSVQKATSYNGTAKDLFKKIITRHNSMMTGANSYKRFEIGVVDIENARVVIPGKKDDNDKYYGTSVYEQAVIESIADEWLTSYDYINQVLLEYLGGYLVARYDASKNKNYIDIVSIESLEERVTAAKLDDFVPTIEFGKNLIDINEELKGEDVFTVIIPIGDDNLTIKNVSRSTVSRYQSVPKYSKINRVEINGKAIGLEDREASARYGRIVRSHSFSNVNSADTLYEDGIKFLASHKNVPVTYTIQAIDLRYTDSAQFMIELGAVVKISSYPHSIDDLYLACTKIEYDLDHPENTRYTFGNPEQSLTERYKKNKDKEKSDSNHNDSKGGGAGGGAAAAAAAEEAQQIRDLTLQNEQALVQLHQEINDNYATQSLVTQFKTDTTNALASFMQYCDGTYATTEMLTEFNTANTESRAKLVQYADDKYAEQTLFTEFKTDTSYALASLMQHCESTYATIEMLTEFTTANSESRAKLIQYADSKYAEQRLFTEFKADTAYAMASFMQHCESTYATTEMLTLYETAQTHAQAKLEQRVAKDFTKTEMFNDFKNGEFSETKSRLTLFANALTAFANLYCKYKDGKAIAKADMTLEANDLYAVVKNSTEFRKGVTNAITSIEQKSSDNSSYIKLLSKYFKEGTDKGGKAKLDIVAKEFWSKIKNEAAITKEDGSTVSVAKVLTQATKTSSIVSAITEYDSKRAYFIINATARKTLIEMSADEIKVLGKAAFQELVADVIEAKKFTISGSFVSNGTSAINAFAGDLSVAGSGGITASGGPIVAKENAQVYGTLYIGKKGVALDKYIDGRISDMVTKDYILNSVVGSTKDTKIREYVRGKVQGTYKSMGAYIQSVYGNHTHSVSVSMSIGHTHTYTKPDGTSGNTGPMSTNYKPSASGTSGKASFS